jgi:hypothetical protein
MRGTKPASPIVHVVVVWLKEPGNGEHRTKMIETARSLKSIPGILDIQVGTTLPSERPIVDATFDVAIVITFKDEPSLRAYDPHPKHVQAVQNVLQPLAQKVVIYDFVDRR